MRPDNFGIKASIMVPLGKPEEKIDAGATPEFTKKRNGRRGPRGKRNSTRIRRPEQQMGRRPLQSLQKGGTRVVGLRKMKKFPSTDPNSFRFVGLSYTLGLLEKKSGFVFAQPTNPEKSRQAKAKSRGHVCKIFGSLADKIRQEIEATGIKGTTTKPEHSMRPGNFGIKASIMAPLASPRRRSTLAKILQKRETLVVDFVEGLQVHEYRLQQLPPMYNSPKCLGIWRRYATRPTDKKNNDKAEK
ncbi:unnamed protein product [Caenorhabditis auriculariae]|uniref:Uncharacterized protein n=1 Tax=Caenorhabditis auriculariae TaxID=2777116 RepID=A0A8S1GY56_9PELO|nr:unnamed protein product [Caenorhabditis auriculariae]